MDNYEYNTPAEINTLRCIICDKVNNPEVQNLPGAFMGDHNLMKFFYQDTKHTDAFVCVECKIEIDDTLSDYDYRDPNSETWIWNKS